MEKVDVRKIFAPAFCEAGGLLRARHGGGASAQRRRTRPRPAADRHAPASFPNGFCLGHGDLVLSDRRRRRTKTAAAVRSGTRSATRPARSRTAPTRDRANDHYHRYKEDVRLIKRSASRPIVSRSRGRGCFRKGRARPIPRASISTIACSTSSSPTASSPTRRCIIGTCRRRCRIASAAGNPATRQRRSRITPAMSPSV